MPMSFDPATNYGTVFPFARPAKMLHPDDLEHIYRPTAIADIVEQIKKWNPLTQAEYELIEAAAYYGAITERSDLSIRRRAA